MQRALNVPNVGPPHDILELARDAEAAGFDGVFLWDHIQFVADLGLEMIDPWVTAGALACVTDRLMLGTIVTPLPRRRPHKLAKEIVTLDHLSGGRVTVGFGLGETAADEFGAFGEPEGAPTRAAALDEGLAVLDGLLRGDRVDIDGDRVTAHARLRPASVQLPRPKFWIAAGAPATAPRERSYRWDGIAPISVDGEPLAPSVLAAYLSDRPDSGSTGQPFDVVATRDPAFSAAEYEAAGATWLIDSVWPMGDWMSELRQAAGLT